MAISSLARSAEGYALAFAGAIAGGAAAAGATAWVLERTATGTTGIEDIAEGFADLGTIILFGFLGASMGCYALLRLRRQPAAGPTAAALLVASVGSPIVVLLLPDAMGALWVVFLLAAPLLARGVGIRISRYVPPPRSSPESRTGSQRT